VGQITDSLNGFFEVGTFEFGEEQRKDNGRRKTEDQFIKADYQGIGKNFLKTLGPEETLKVFKPHPGTAGYAKTEIEILKGDLNPVYGDIVEYNVIDQSGNKEEHELPVFPIAVQYPFLFFYFILDHRYLSSPWRLKNPPPRTGTAEIRNLLLLVSLFG
jgi:hypothetical protein